MSKIITPDGEDADVPLNTAEKDSPRRRILDALTIALVLAGSAAWLNSSADVRLNSRDISRHSADIVELKQWKDEQTRDNRRLAETMATRADVKEVADQVRALAAEIRTRNGRQ